MSRSIFKLSFFLALAGLAAARPATTFASSTAFDEAPARVVSYADLDLRSNTGVATLYSRIRSAARSGPSTSDWYRASMHRH